MSGNDMKFLIELEFDLDEFDESKLTDEYVEKVCKKQLERKGVKVRLIKKEVLTVKNIRLVTCQSCGSHRLKLVDEENDVYLCKDCGNTQTPMLNNVPLLWSAH